MSSIQLLLMRKASEYKLKVRQDINERRTSLPLNDQFSFTLYALSNDFYRSFWPSAISSSEEFPQRQSSRTPTRLQ
jgi:hypothetical protein